MNNEEAISMIERIIDDSGIYGNPALTKNAEKALLMAIDALEKQIPKETLKKKNVHGEFEYYCPVCGEYCGYKGLQSLAGSSYCGNCGQYLDFDWSE